MEECGQDTEHTAKESEEVDDQSACNLRIAKQIRFLLIHSSIHSSIHSLLRIGCEYAV